MKVRSLSLIALLLFSGIAALGQTEQPKAVGGIEEVYLAKDDGDGRAGEQVSEFRTTDVPIYCVVLLASGASTVVKMNFVAVSVAGVKAETKVVTASYTTKDGQNRVNFSGRPEGKWPPGKYRVDLFLDGKKASEVEFNIKSISGAINTGTSAVKNFQNIDSPKPKPRKVDPVN